MLTWPNHACCCVHHSSFQGWSKVGLENCRTAMTSLRRGRHWNIMNPKPLFYMQWTFSKCIFVYSRYRVRNFEPKIPVNVCNFPFDSGIYENTVKTYTCSWIFVRGVANVATRGKMVLLIPIKEDLTLQNTACQIMSWKLCLWSCVDVNVMGLTSVLIHCPNNDVNSSWRSHFVL